MKLSTRIFAFRRRVVAALATRKQMSLRARLILAVLIFAVSYATKSLQAVDLAPIMYTVEQPFSGLTDTYDRRAVSILEGEGLLGPYAINPSRTVWLAQAPGYSIYLSVVYRILGRDFFKVQSIQNGLNSLSPILIFLIAGGLISWRVGAVSGLLAAVSHHMSHMSNFILADSLSALPLLAAIYILTLARRSGHPYWLYAMAGAMIGVSIWLRAQGTLAGPFIAALLTASCTRRRPMLKRASVMTAVSLLVMTPITVRNYLVYGEFVPVQIGVGLNLWEGIGESSGDRFGAVAKDHEVAAQEAILYNNPQYGGTWSSPDGIQRDRDRVKKSLRIIGENPVWYAGVMLNRAREMVKYSAHAPLVYKIGQERPLAPPDLIKPQWKEIVSDGASLAFGRSIFWLRPVIRPLQRISKEVMQIFILIGAAVLLVASWRRALFILMVPLYYFLFQGFMHTEFRYTLPMQYFLFVFAAITWVLISAAIWSGLKAILRASARLRRQ